MRIGVPKEIKNHEYRVGLTPASVRELTANGHSVWVQSGAGTAIGLTDEQYIAAGATLAATAAEVFEKSEMIVKVKEPIPSEYGYFREGLIIYTYLHLAAVPELAAELLRKKVTGIARGRCEGA